MYQPYPNISKIFYYTKYGITIINISQQFHVVVRYIKYEKALGKKFKEQREKRGLSQEELAELVGVNQNQISRLENATHGATISTIISVAVALGYEPKEFFDINEKLDLNTEFGVISGNKRPTTETLYLLLKTDFLVKPQSVKMITAECKMRYGVELKSAAVSGALIKFFDKKLLKRIPAPQKGRFLYQK